ncbi:Uncharacterized protein SCF082_LOCUS40266 [Durusdinium trenchii]|uniref:Uncharacterized protein n=1 Tax=Durusdinium trenchii TaxID=1381693 RepID=A0ABP0Q9M3_9DINO
MKVSQRFEILMQQRRLQPDAASMTDGDLLQSIVSKFNNFKANAALKKWQVTPDQHSAILGIVCGMTQESRQDYCQDLDALVMGRPNNITVQMVGMWQDHIGKSLMKKAAGEHGSAADQETAVTCANLAHDYREAVAFNLKKNKVNNKFGEADITRTHHLGYCDLSKMGRLTALNIDQVSRWAKGVLDMNPDFSVLNGLRGEFRRIEDKFMSMGMELKSFERVVLELQSELSDNCHVCLYAETENPTIFQYAVTQVKDKLLEVVSNPETAPAPCPNNNAENMDLGETRDESTTTVASSGEAPPSMTPDEFKQKYPEVGATVSLNLGGHNVICHYVDGKAFLTSPSKILLAGLDSANPRPLFLYSGGQWISDSSKAKDFLSKPANESKGVEFRLESADSMVVLEEPVQGGSPQDTSPMMLHKLLKLLEQRGVVQFTVTGHQCDRPPEVKRGEAADRFEVKHESFSVYKPNNVNLKQVKAGSLAGLIGTKALSKSRWVKMVWRTLVNFGSSFWMDI